MLVHLNNMVIHKKIRASQLYCSGHGKILSEMHSERSFYLLHKVIFMNDLHGRILKNEYTCRKELCGA